MGDISAEPSMEEILSSIKRIIAEEGDAAVSARSRRGRSASASPAEGGAPVAAGADTVLELDHRLSALQPEEAPAPAQGPEAPGERVDPILSERAVEATRGPLEALSRMVVKPDVAGSDTLEGLVRELLKPMLREWLDANLPQIVETMVSREISRITGRQG